ncbi:MAG TPA: pyridoxal phosphate-dependent aminotransferase [Methanomassiliicoccales archaeon]|nr:pyridoxal phosphate-dependent aminotransferase [Methanomassiliicoccales archaeon]
MVAKIAKRMSNVPESGTMKMASIVSKLKAEGVDIISFSVGEPDFPTPDNITKACIKALNEHFTHYTPSSGIPELRRAVAEVARRDNGIPCVDKNVVITPTKQAIFMTFLAMLDEGDEVVMPDPAWGTFDATVRIPGGVPKLVEVKPEDDYRMLPNAVAEAITSRTKMILINTPSNPLGSIMEASDVKGIADLAIDHDLAVLADETYEKIIFEGKHHSIAALPGMFERTVTVSGFSKTYAMTGWRVGWSIAPPDITREINKLQTQSISCATSFAQVASVEALRGPQDSVKHMVAEFQARRDLVYDILKDIPQLHCPKPKGAFYMFPSYDARMNSDDMAAYLLEKAHVGVTPGSAFGPAGEGHFRISYAASRHDLTEGMKRIKEALAKL